jgi:hypothetical protein
MVDLLALLPDPIVLYTLRRRKCTSGGLHEAAHVTVLCTRAVAVVPPI